MSKPRLVGIDCPILFAVLQRKKKDGKQTFASLELDVTLPQGIVGAILVHEKDEEQFRSILAGEMAGWEGPDGRWMISETIDTPAHGRVSVELRWYPVFDQDAKDDLNDPSWVKSKLCKYVEGVTQVRAVPERGYGERLEMYPNNPPTSIKEGIEWIKLHHFNKRILSPYGAPTGAIPPDIYPKTLGRHLVQAEGEWIILEVAKLEEPSSPPEPDSSL